MLLFYSVLSPTGRRERAKPVSTAADEERALNDLADDSERRQADVKAARAEARRLRAEERLREQEKVADTDAESQASLEAQRKRLSERSQRQDQELQQRREVPSLLVLLACLFACLFACVVPTVLVLSGVPFFLYI